MLKRTLLAIVLVAAPLFAAVPKAPADIPHPIAMFLAKMSNAKKVTFRAQAVGKRFFFEEVSTGVTVYAFDGNGYRRERFVKGATLEQAIRRYGKR